MSPFIGLSFDVVLLGAFGVTVYYCVRLSRQFDQMQADRKAFDALIQSLNTASSRAEGAIHAFKDIAANSGSSLQEKINKVRGLSDELEIMIQAGDNLANRLQVIAEKSRRATIPDTDRPAAADIITDEPPPKSRAEKELLEALRAKQRS